MSQGLNAAYAREWDLATTLMDYVVVFRAGATEYDGDRDLVVHEFDPHLR